MGDNNSSYDDKYSVAISVDIVNFDEKIKEKIQAKLDSMKDLHLSISDVDFSNKFKTNVQNKLDSFTGLQLSIDNIKFSSNTVQVLQSQLGNLNINTTAMSQNLQKGLNNAGKQVNNFVNTANKSLLSLSDTDIKSHIDAVFDNGEINIIKTINNAKSALSSLGDVRVKKANFNADELENIVFEITKINNGIKETRNLTYQLSGKKLNFEDFNNGSEKLDNTLNNIQAKATAYETTLDSLKSKYNDVNTSKPILDPTHQVELKKQYAVIETCINNVKNANSKTFVSMNAEADKQIQKLKDLAKQYKNEEYVATSLRTSDKSTVKSKLENDLKVFEAKINKAGLTKNLSTEISNLKTQLNNAFDKDALVEFMNQLDIVEGKFKTLKMQNEAGLFETDSQIQEKYYNRIIDNIKQIYNLKIKAISAGKEETAEIERQITLLEKRNKYNESQLNKKGLTSNTHAQEVNDTKQILENRLKIAQTKANDKTNTDNEREELKNAKELESAERRRLEVLSQMSVYRIQNTKLFQSSNKDAKELAVRFNEIEILLKQCNSKDMPDLISKFKVLKNEVKAKGLGGNSFLTELIKDGKKIFNWFTSGSLIMSVVNGFKQGVKTVIELDQAMINLKKVCEATDKEFSDFFKDATQTAVELGSTITDIINSTADFSRLGYKLTDAKELAKVATLYKNVGDGISQSDASSSIVSTMKAFNIEAKDSINIVDKFNEVGNRFAISSAGIGDALLHSASALYEANNDLSQSIGLIVGANNVIQDTDVVGNAWKTIALRIRGAKTELEDAGLDTENMVESTSKLRDMIKGMTGFDILEKDNKTFKSTYDIIVGIGKEYQKLSDIDQASLLEALSGKRQSNVLASALNNIQDIERAYAVAQNSSGSAMKENENQAKGINYQINQMKAKIQEISALTINSGLVDFIVKIGNGIADLIIKLGGLQGTIVTIVGLLSFKKLGIFTEITKQFIDFASLLAKTQVSSIGTSVALNGLGNTLKTLGTAISTVMVSHPILLGITAIGTAVAGTVIAYKKIKQAQEEARESLTTLHDESISKIDDIKDSYDELKKSIDDTKSKIEENSDKLAQLYKLRATGKISESEYNYITVLEQQNEALRKQLEYQENLAEIKAHEAQNEAVKSLGQETYGTYYENTKHNGLEYIDDEPKSLMTDSSRLSYYSHQIKILNDNLKTYEKGIKNVNLSEDEYRHARVESEKFSSLAIDANGEQKKEYLAKAKAYKDLYNNQFTQDDYNLLQPQDRQMVEEYSKEVDNLVTVLQNQADAITDTTGKNYELKQSTQAVINEAQDNIGTYSTYLKALQGDADSLNKVLDITKNKLDNMSKSGNVDLTNRPKVSSAIMQNAGYDVSDVSTATVFSQGGFVWQGSEENGKYVYVHYTPILPDGTVMTKEQTAKYLNKVLSGSTDIINKDKENNNIVMKVSDVDVSEADIKNLQENGVMSQKIRDFLFNEDTWDEEAHQLSASYYGLVDDMSDYTIGSYENTGNKFKEYLDTLTGSDLKSTLEEYSQLITSGGITEENIQSLSTFNEIQTKTALNTKELVSAIKSYFGELKYSDLMSGLSDALTDVITAENELAESNVVSFDTMQKLLASYPELKDKVIATADGYKIEKSALEDIIINKTKIYGLDIVDATKSAESVLTSLGVQIGAYDSTAESIKKLIKAKILLLQTDNALYKPSNLKTLRDQQEYNSKFNNEKFNINETSLTQEQYNQNKEDIKALQEALQGIENAEANKKNADEIIEQLRKSLKGKTSGSGSSSNSSISTSEFSQSIDWLDRLLKQSEKTVDDYDKKLANANSIKKRIEATNNLIKAQNNLKDNVYKKIQNEYDSRYSDSLKTISGLGFNSNEIKKLIENGSLDIQKFIDKNVKSGETSTKEKLYNAINDAINWYDKSVDIKDKTVELIGNIKLNKDSLLDLNIEDYNNRINVIDNLIEQRKTKLDEIGESNIQKHDYNYMISLSKKKSDYYEKEKELYEDAIKDTQKESDAYYDLKNKIAECGKNIASCTVEQKEWNQSILELSLSKLNDINDALNKTKDNLLEQKDQYDSVLASANYELDKKIEYWNDMKESTEDYYKNIIDPLQEELDLLQKTNSERSNAIALQKAEYDLAKAQNNKTNRVYYADKGWVYEADSEAVRNAQQSLDEARYNDKTFQLQSKIDKLNESQNSFTDAYDKEIEALNKIKESYSEIADVYENNKNLNIAKSLFGDDFQNQVLSGNLDLLTRIKDTYVSLSDSIANNDEAINNNEKLTESISQIIEDWIKGKTTFEEAQNQINDILLQTKINVGDTLETNEGLLEKSKTNIKNGTNEEKKEIKGTTNVISSETNKQKSSVNDAVKSIYNEYQTLSDNLNSIMNSLKVAMNSLASSASNMANTIHNALSSATNYFNDLSNVKDKTDVLTTATSIPKLNDKSYSKYNNKVKATIKHDGMESGFVGDGAFNSEAKKRFKEIALGNDILKDDEIISILKNGEAVLNNSQQSNVLKSTYQSLKQGLITGININKTNDGNKNVSKSVSFDGDINVYDVTDKDFANKIKNNLPNAMLQELYKDD